MAQRIKKSSVTREEEDKTKKIYSDSGGITHKASADVGKSTSLTSLIIWNVSKALELNPKMVIKNAIKVAQARLETDDLKSIIPEYPEQRHLACALLAWQQLGHSNADSLCEFVDNQINSDVTERFSKSTNNIENPKQNLQSVAFPKNNLFKIDCYSMGPVIKLPIEPKIVMRIENNCNMRQTAKKPIQSSQDTEIQSQDTEIQSQDTEIMNKIEAACCMDSECVERLTAVDAATRELRTRAAKLARREAERVELLERAESAWKDLELGYQRRLTLAQEKEADISKQLRKMIEERNGHKDECMHLVQQLKKSSDNAERDRAHLSQIEKQVIYDRACNKQRLSEELARTEATLTEHQCQAAQIERDFHFKEEQARRKVLNFESELESARTLTLEAERAMRAELAALKDQVSVVSKQLLEEDANSERIKELLADMRQEKMNMITDLEGCKTVCDGNMQIITNELNKKRQQLVELKKQVMECRCKLPVDASVEAKRTPSLAALCRCTAEDKILDACSCTSIRSRLLSNLLSDLFGGLQAELGGSSSAEMPCQLLKCLEDKHNWDRASVVKTNLKNYFSHLLLGELDIAITNCIEKYHARWVGETCADRISKMSPGSSEDISEEGWQERAIEKRAQKLATELAEQLFKERADQLTQQAMEYVSKGPPPCECKPANTDAAVYPCLVKTVPQLDLGFTTPPPSWKEAMKDVTQLRKQIEDLKKDSIKKQDLKQMELKIAKIVKHASCTENHNTDNITASLDSNVIKRDQRFNKYFDSKLYGTQNKYGLFKKNQVETIPKRGNKLNSADNAVNLGNDKCIKQKKFGQTHVINPSCCSKKEPNKLTQQNKNQNNGLNDRICKPKTSFIVNNVITSKPIEKTLQAENFYPSSKSSREDKCHNVCFHRVPSNTSIDKLLETLTKWKTDIDKHENKEINNHQSELVPCQCPATKKKSSKSTTDLKKKKKRIKKHDCLNLDSDQYANSRKSSEISLKSKQSTTASLRSTLSKKEEKPLGCKLKSCASSTTKNKKKTPSMCSVKPCKSKDTANRKVSVNKLSSKSTVSVKKVESEYMGAINLDKSNEDLCKCTNEKDKTKQNKTINAPVPPAKLFKCITSSKCNCDKVLKTRSFPTKRKDANDIPQQDIKKDADKCFIHFVNQDNDSPPQLNKNSSNVEPVTDCNYNIKFLGVTLADVDSKKQHVGFLRENEETETSFNRFSPTDITLTNECGCLVNPNFTQPAKKGGGETVSVCCVSEQLQKNIKDQTNKQCLDKMLSCECIAQFDEFKNYIDMALQQEYSNNDKSLDTQSFSSPIAEPENCVCCNNIHGDESKELEENAFHLLEEHLKQKLEEFKVTSCQSSCIPPEEEKRLFSTILKRVKKVISESTNKISCKCSGKGGDGQGSWSRAYGLLQEYLKIKIKRVQCSCVLVEDNKDTILPDVLDKVCNLIESDFKRLKDVCKCQPKKDVTKKDKAKLNYTGETPEKDVNIDFKTLIDKPNSRRSIHQESILSQVSKDFGLNAKSCDPMEPFIKKLHASQDVQSFQALNNEQECNYCAHKEVDSNISNNNRRLKLEPHNKNENNILTVPECNELNKITVGSKRNRCLSVPCIYTNYPCANDCSYNGDLSKANMWRVNETKTTSSKGIIIENEHCVDINNITIPEKSRSVESFEIKNTLEQHDEAKSKQYICNSDVYECSQTQCDQNETVGTETGLENIPISPYIGYTIECSCENKLGKCVCGRGTFKPNKEIINNVWKKSLQNKNYIDKMAYILNNTNEKSNDVKKDCYTAMTDKLLVQTDKVSKQQHVNFDKFDRETEMSAISEEELALGDSNEQFNIVNTMTNTYDDNNSYNSDYSINEESLDWCECCSQIKTDMHSQFKKSIYYPAPLQDNYDYPSKSDTNFSFSSDKKHRKHCNCDMVPICHVKMLVENIENKLARSKCTCDSLIPKVCPVHTPK